MSTAQKAFAPGPKQVFPVLNLVKFQRHRLEFVTQMAREYGDVAFFYFGPQPMVLLNEPEAIRDVLVTHSKNFMKGEGLQRAKRLLGEGLLTSEGEFHLRQRRLMQPAFHRQRIAGYAATMVEFAERMSQRWQPGAQMDIAREMMHLTLAIAGKTLFDADVEGEADEIGNALSEAMTQFNRLTLPFAQWLEKLPLPATRKFQQARARLDATIYRMIAERRRSFEASGEDRGDLLSMLLAARDTEGDGTGMTDEQLRDEAMTIFLAGHETTANALTWTWYLLHGRLPRAEDYPRLRYTEMVLAEAMRLYPPAWIIGRRALQDYSINGYDIPARTIILMSQYVTHRDSRWFPEPERFDPERWTPEAKETRPKFSYYPFGGGNRICIGEQFAWMEGVLVLATVAQRWRMRLLAGHQVELEPIVTLRPKHGPLGAMPMVLERR
jgi:cytochrome P450